MFIKGVFFVIVINDVLFISGRRILVIDKG